MKNAPNTNEILVEQMMYQPFFDLVADKTNWKNPIHAVVDAPDCSRDRALYIQMIRQAVIFFAGCSPTINEQKDGTLLVEAAGYYSAVGS